MNVDIAYPFEHILVDDDIKLTLLKNLVILFWLFQSQAHGGRASPATRMVNAYRHFFVRFAYHAGHFGTGLIGYLRHERLPSFVKGG